MGDITVEKPVGSAHEVTRRVFAELEDGRTIVLHAPGDVVDAERAKALKDRDAAALGDDVVKVHVEGEDEEKAEKADKADKAEKATDEPRTAKRSAPGR